MARGNSKSRPFYQLSTNDHQLFRKAGRHKLAAPVSKTGSASPRSEHYRRLPPTINQWRFYGRRIIWISTRRVSPAHIFCGACRSRTQWRATQPQTKPITQTKGNSMKPVIRYQSQLLFRKSYKPIRILRFTPTKLKIEFRPVRFGVKPQIKTYND
jgi:hypothetical protein